MTATAGTRTPVTGEGLRVLSGTPLKVISMPDGDGLATVEEGRREYFLEVRNDGCGISVKDGDIGWYRTTVRRHDNVPLEMTIVPLV